MTLAYSNIKKDHIGHLRIVLDTLAQQKSYDKSWPTKIRSLNCKFAYQDIEYLDYIISGEGVKAYPNMVEAMLS